MIDSSQAKASAQDVPRAIILSLLKVYKLGVSPFMAPRCRFYPSCSSYAIEAVQRYGPFKGLTMALWRLLKCHPFHPGGYDPVP